MPKPIYCAETQFLTIAYAKNVGLDRSGRVVAFDPVEQTREQVGLTPLLVYAIVVPAYSMFYRMLVDPRATLSVSSFLAMAWSADAQMGMPYSLEVKPQLFEADRGFVRWTKDNDVAIEPPSKMKSINAFERSSLAVRFAISWIPGGLSSNSPRNLKLSNEGMQYYDRFVSGGYTRKFSETLTFKAWSSREKRFFVGKTSEVDWDKSSLQEKAQPRPSDRTYVCRKNEEPVHVEGIKELVAMWPGGPRSFFKDLDISRQDFDFWVRGRAHLNSMDFAQLRDHARIYYEEDIDEWRLQGGYLLTASTPSDVVSLYDTLSHGGDLRFSFELLGPEGEAPEFRFLVFESWGGLSNIILFERGSSAEKALDKRKLINLGDPVRAPLEVWNTANQIIENRVQFELPCTIGSAFSSKFDEWFTSREEAY